MKRGKEKFEKLSEKVSIVAKFEEVSVRPAIDVDIAKTPCGRARITFKILFMNFSSKAEIFFEKKEKIIKLQKEEKKNEPSGFCETFSFTDKSIVKPPSTFPYSVKYSFLDSTQRASNSDFERLVTSIYPVA